MNRQAGPLRDDEVDALLAGEEGEAAIALAVSGGSDSLALLDLVHRWSLRCQPRPVPVVLTVDHGLREGSAAEAAMVAQLATARGLRHETLVWDGPKPATGIEAAAREARYRLLDEAARRAGARVLFTAHHLEDQAETVLMRLGRGSGIGGLAGMAARRQLAGDGVTLVRPLLDVPRARLVATALAAGFTPADDPMNGDPRFARARLRKVMPGLAGAGVDAAALVRAARLFRRADEALALTTRIWLVRNVAANALGVASLRRVALIGEPQEIRLRALGAMLAAIGGSGAVPGDGPLGALDDAVLAGLAFRRTLAGAVIRTRGPDIVLHREPGRMDVAETMLPAGYSGLWDGRFRVTVGGAEDVSVGPLAARGYAELPRASRARPRAAAETVPAFRRQGRLVAVPALGFTEPGGEGLLAVEVAAAGLSTAARGLRSGSASRAPTLLAGTSELLNPLSRIG
ncbi:MAG: tRNA lysidine(34) synthetase TilS [Bauldia sp.]|nr:tRNA lysidine(34) synthetase TilS [Bauldia sp.]